MAGHNKWSKVKHIKARVDVVRGKVFSKCAHEIAIAARDGGGDPGMNPRLRAAIDNAKSVSMPKDKIERAVKKGTGELGGEAIQEATYEGYGPEGIAFLIEAATDNLNRTAADMRSIFTKSGGSVADPGSVAYQFDRKGEITYSAEVGDADTVMMAAIEAGAEDVESSEEGHTIWCADTDLNEVSSALEAELGESESTKLAWRPTTTTEMDIEAMQKLMKLVDALEDDDDVQRVTTNFEASDEVMAQL